jgi:CDP-diacylglycerol--serine O-phosphatidyltransferase
MRRHGRRAYIRSVYFLPSMATLGNAVCGFAAMYVASLAAMGVTANASHDQWTQWWARHGFIAAAYLIFIAMIFDALDGRLARFARHTTDFGGQLDSLADVVSFGAAPAFVAMQLFKVEVPDIRVVYSRAVWAIGALYFCCAAIRLARFNVSNEHGEQHHFSFLGLPSPGAGGTVAAWILMQHELRSDWPRGADICSYFIPFLVLSTGLLMVSNFRYPHVVNRWLRGKRSVDRLLLVVILALLLVVWHQYTLAIGTFLYAFYGPVSWLLGRLRKMRRPPPASPALP